MLKEKKEILVSRIAQFFPQCAQKPPISKLIELEVSYVLYQSNFFIPVHAETCYTTKDEISTLLC